MDTERESEHICCKMYQNIMDEELLVSCINQDSRFSSQRSEASAASSARQKPCRCTTQTVMSSMFLSRSIQRLRASSISALTALWGSA